MNRIHDLNSAYPTEMDFEVAYGATVINDKVNFKSILRSYLVSGCVGVQVESIGSAVSQSH